MSKRILSIIMALVICCVFCVGTTACNSAASAPESASEPEPAEESDVDAPFVLPDGIDREVLRAINLGLVPKTLQSDFDKTATEKELCTLFGNAVALLDSSKLPKWETMSANATNISTIRQEVAMAGYLAATLFTDMPRGNTQGNDSHIDWERWGSGEVDFNGNYGPSDCPDGTLIFSSYPNDPVYSYTDAFGGLFENFPFTSLARFYALGTSSRYSHNMMLELAEDGAGMRMEDPLTREEAILAAVRWYDSWPATPVYITAEDPRAIESTITAEQITSAAHVPEASNQFLPAWKGCGNSTKCSAAGTNGGNGVQEFYESDVKFMAENGFDFMRVCFGFTTLGAPDYPKDDEYINLNELYDLDQLIGWGLKYGVHMQISMFSPPKRFTLGQEWSWASNWAEVDHDNYSAEEWDMTNRCFVMLAKRYKDIPRDYISFELGSEWVPDDVPKFIADWTPIVNNIWEITPDRILMTSTDGGDNNGIPAMEGMAKLGVTVNNHSYEPRGFAYFQNDGDTGGEEDKTAVSPTWPYTDKYGVTWSGEKVYETYLKPIRDIAQKYNVGFMIGEVGVCNNPRGAGIAQSDAIAFSKEMVKALSKRGIAYSQFGLAGDMNMLRQYDPDITARNGETMTPITYHFDDYDYTFYADMEMVNVWNGKDLD